MKEDINEKFFTAYNEGKMAELLGANKSTNPYQAGGVLYGRWNEGYKSNKVGKSGTKQN